MRQKTCFSETYLQFKSIGKFVCSRKPNVSIFYNNNNKTWGMSFSKSFPFSFIPQKKSLEKFTHTALINTKLHSQIAIWGHKLCVQIIVIKVSSWGNLQENVPQIQFHLTILILHEWLHSFLNNTFWAI